MQTVWDALAVGDVTAAEFVSCVAAILRRETAEAVVEPFLASRSRPRRCGHRPGRADAAHDGGRHRARSRGNRRPRGTRPRCGALARTATTDEQMRALREMAGDDIDLWWRATREAALGPAR